MNPKNISLGLSIITKDKHRELRRLLKTCKEVNFDEIVVLDTGSKKPTDTKNVCQKFGAEFYSYHENPHVKETKQFGHIFDFGHARNTALSKMTTDYVMWLDSDDELRNGNLVRPLLAKVIDSGKEGISAYYLYAKDEHGNVHTEQWRERIFPRNRVRWYPFVHEICMEKEGESPLELEFLSKMNSPWVEHDCVIKPTNRSDRDIRNLRIIDFHKKRNNGKLESRMWHYAGKSFMGLNQWKAAIGAFEEHLKESGSEMHRYDSLICQAECYQKMKLWDMARGTAFRAVAEQPKWPQAWTSLCITCMEMRRWDDVLFYNSVGLLCEEDTSTYSFSPIMVRKGLGITRHRALTEIEHHEEARDVMAALHRDFPKDPEFKRLYEISTSLLRDAKKASHWSEIMNELVSEDRGFDERAEELARLAPKSVKQFNKWSFLKRKEPPCDRPSLAIICPGSRPLFGPSSLNKGIGGSEEAVIHLSKALSDRGYYVDVFRETNEEGEHDGVRWYPFAAIRKKDRYDVVIGWRNPDIFETRYPNARTNVLWCHDIPVPGQIKPYHVKNIDYVMALSKDHAQYYDGIVPKEKIIITRNGLSSSWFADPKNNPKKVIYASNPTRGLWNLFHIWPNVFKITGAELHFFYGFTDWHKAIVAHQPREQMLMVDMRNRFSELVRQGHKIFDHGMVGHNELHKHMASSGVWAYPTSFPETNCLTAYKMQAHGAVPVTSRYAALNESVQWGEKVGHQEIPTMEPESQDLKVFEDKLINMILDANKQKDIRKDMIPWARKHLTWEEVADQLWEVFEEGKKDRMVLVPPAPMNLILSES